MHSGMSRGRCLLAWRIALGASLATLAGCTVESSNGPESTDPLCDGTTDVRLYYRTTGGFPIEDDLLLMDNGWQYLYVTGDCQYWAHGYDEELGAWGPVRTGVLAPDDAEALADDIDYGTWKTWRASCYIADDTVQSISDGSALLERNAQCAEDGGYAAFTQTPRWASALYEAGGDLGEGPMRLASTRTTRDPGDAAYPTLGFSIKDGWRPMTISDSARLAELRALRDGLWRGEFDFGNPSSLDLYVVEESTVYHVAFRDIIPFEGNSGVDWPRP